MDLVKLFPVHQYSVDIFHILVLREYCALMESRIPAVWAGAVGVVVVVHSVSSHEKNFYK